MYERFFDLKQLPFENTFNACFFYASEQHREALAAIEYTIRMRKGIVLVTGDIGSGKTTVGRTMLQRCGKIATIATLLHGHRCGKELTAHVLRTLQVDFEPSDDHATMLERLHQFLLIQARQQRPVVLFVDEAQTLSDEALEELRLLCNFDLDGIRLLQLVLVGQPELRDRIRQPQMAALRQRIVMAKRLRPLSADDTRQYIQHRLTVASNDPQNVRVTFSDGAIQSIHRFTGGVPRLINVACDNCLLLGSVRDVTHMTSEMVLQVLDDMLPSFNRTSDDDTNQSSPLSLAGNF